jgi:regulator of protease activity HflC (stomatin/prohibitin superfamily)
MFKAISGWLAFALVFLIAIVGLSSIDIVPAGQNDVLLNWGQTVGTLKPGFHVVKPISQSTDRYNISIQKFEIPAEAQTKDLQNLKATFAVNFKLNEDKLVEIRNVQGTLENIVERIITPQTQESFKIAASIYSAEESVANRANLKQAFDEAITTRLAPYYIEVFDTSIVDIGFDPEFAAAVERKQIKEQEALMAKYEADQALQQAQATVNKAKGEAEAQQLIADSLKTGGPLVLQKQAIEAWKQGGSQMPKILILGGEKNGQAAMPPFIFNTNGPV